jgi:hypothetical protein
MEASAQARLTSAERFELLEQLGSGGNGTVHRARDTALGIEVAIKILARTEGARRLRFKREFRAFSGGLHPNLVRLYELFADDAQWFISMELVRGVPFERSRALDQLAVAADARGAARGADPRAAIVDPRAPRGLRGGGPSAGARACRGRGGLGGSRCGDEPAARRSADPGRAPWHRAADRAVP